MKIVMPLDFHTLDNADKPCVVIEDAIHTQLAVLPLEYEELAQKMAEALNCHDELVQALEDAIIWLEQCAGFKAPASRATMANYRAILAKAKPEA